MKRKSPKRRNPNTQTARELADEEELVLRCLGGAVLIQWNELPRKIQRTLFEYAISVGDPRDVAQLKGLIARFLHKHKNEE